MKRVTFFQNVETAPTECYMENISKPTSTVLVLGHQIIIS